MANLKSSSTAGGSLVWTQTNLPVAPQDDKIFYKDMELVDSKNNQTIAGKKDFTTGATVPTPVAANDAANKSYVDSKDSTSVKSVRGTAPIKVTTGVNPTVSIDASTPTAAGSMSAADKAKLDNHPMDVVNKAGDNMTGNLTTTGDITANGNITSKAGLVSVKADGLYSMRLINSGAVQYVQGGKVDRTEDDQRLWMTGWFGTPLSEFTIAMKDGVNPRVRMGVGGAYYDILHRGNMPTPADIKAMGDFTSIPNNNCDSALASGSYPVIAATTNTPKGTGTSGSTLLVNRFGENNISQIYFENSNDEVWVRRKKTTWTPWFELYSTSRRQDTGGMGYGVGDGINATTETGGVRDFNLIKKNGVYTVDGSWINGVFNDVPPTAVTHSGVVHVYQRSIDTLTTQKFITVLNTNGQSINREWVRSWSNATDGWSPWFAQGVYDNTSSYRTGVLRSNIQTGDDGNYAYMSLAKEKFRDTLAAGTWYTVAEIDGRANTNRWDPHSGDILSRVITQASNTVTPNLYYGRLFLSSRTRQVDGNTQDDSTVAISKEEGATFTNAGKRVELIAGRVTADEFLQNTAQSTLVNSSTRKDYVDAEVNKKISKVGDTMTGILTVPTSSGLRTANGADGQHVAISSEGSYALFWRKNPNSTIKANEFIGIDTLSQMLFRQDLGAGNGTYRDQKVYHEGFKPTPSVVGAVNKAGDTMTGDLYIDKGSSSSHPQMGIRRSGRELVLVDDNTSVGLYSRIGGSFINSYLISRNINDGNITIGGDTVNLILRGAGNLKHGSADVYTTANKPSADDVGSYSKSESDGKYVPKTGGTMTGALRITGTYVNTAAVAAIEQLLTGLGTQNLRSFRTDGTNTWCWEKLNGSDMLYSTGTNGNGTNRVKISIGSGDIYLGNADKRVYHEGFKPSASDVNALPITGGTLTGNLTVPKVMLSAAQGTEGNAVTRKDYVDGQIGTRLPLAGGTMTGTLSIVPSSSGYTGIYGVSQGGAFAAMHTAHKPITIGSNTTGSSFAPALGMSYTHNSGWNGTYSLGTLNHNAQTAGAFVISHINGNAGESKNWEFRGADGSLTVPGQLLTSGGLITQGNITTNGQIYTNMGGNAIIIDSTLAQSGYLRGRVNGADSWYIGRGSANSHDVTWSGNAIDTYIQLQSPHIYTNKNVLIGSAQSSAGNALTRKDYVDAVGNQKAPANHTHNAAQGNVDIIAGGNWAVIGSYMLAQKLTASTITAGQLIAGAYLLPSSCGDRYQDGTTLPGTWKCLGIAYDTGAGVESRSTLFIRVS